jgi:hypothetical protein
MADEETQPSQEAQQAEAQEGAQEGAQDEARQREERIARRLERRQQSRRRRLRPGITRGVPWQLSPPDARAQEEALDHEILMIENAVREEGPIDEDDLRKLVGARFWGPGRFRPAVKEAVAEGRVVHVARNRLAPPDQTAQS